MRSGPLALVLSLAATAALAAPQPPPSSFLPSPEHFRSTMGMNDVALDTRGWRVGFGTVIGMSAALVVGLASFQLTCPQFGDLQAAHPSCKGPALIGAAVLTPPFAAAGAFAVGWIMNGNGGWQSTALGGGAGAALALLLWAIPDQTTSGRFFTLTAVTALGAALGFELTSDNKREGHLRLAVGPQGATLVGTF